VNQLPDPSFAKKLVEGDPSEALELEQKIVELEEFWGVDAGDDCRAEAKLIVGKAMLRKIERERPGWDGNTRIVP